MTDTLFITLYDVLSRRLAHDLRSAESAVSLRVVPDALPKRTPVILREAIYKGSASFTGYYPLNEQAYRMAFPKISLTRFNHCNLHNTRKQIFTCGVEWWENVGCLHATLDLPMTPEDTRTANIDLFQFIASLAASLKLHLVPVKLGWYETDPFEKGM